MFRQTSFLLLAIAMAVTGYPESLDWTQTIRVNVKSQGKCGSCWTFAAAGVLEARYQILHGIPSNVNFSEQFFLDCYSETPGCSGGTGETKVLEWFSTVGGIPTEDQYPYKAVYSGACHADPKTYIPLKVASVGGWYNTIIPLYEYNARMEAAMVSALQGGPVAFNMHPITLGFRQRKAGMAPFSDIYCNQTAQLGGHWMVMYGYDATSWLVKSSWGTGWADGGFTRIARGSNICGIYDKIAYPVLTM